MPFTTPPGSGIRACVRARPGYIQMDENDSYLQSTDHVIAPSK